jgi:hypothetical protein
MWLAGGGALLAIIFAVVLILVLTGNKGGQGSASAREAAVSYWTNVNAQKYDAAYAMLTQEVRAQITLEQMRQVLQQQETQMKFISVEATGENVVGDTATVPLVMKTNDNRTANLTATLVKIGNSWFVKSAGQPNIPQAP